MRPRALWTVLALGLGLGAVACSSEPESAPAPGPRPAAPPAVRPDATADPSVAETVSFAYDPTGKRDPFRSFVRGIYGDEPEDLTSPLERFDLSQLSLSAIIWGIDEPRALIVDPSGKGYIVSTGAVMGKNKGRIVSIDDNKLVVKETYVDSFDRATTKPVELRLRNTEGG